MPTLGVNTVYCKIPKLNPLRFLKYDNNTLNDFFVNEISDFETDVQYLQPFQYEDPINAQIQVLTSNVTSYKMELIDNNFNVFLTANASLLYEDTATGFSYIHFNMIPDSATVRINEGCYYALITLDVISGYTTITERYISEPISLKAAHENTVAIDYRHSENAYDMWFQKVLTGTPSVSWLSFKPATGAMYRHRCYGGLWSKDLKTATDDVIYIDQSHDARILNSVPYNVYKWSFGSARGVPEWVYDKLVRIFCCEFVQIDGQYYTKNESAQVEFETVDRYPMRTCTIETLKKDNAYDDKFSLIVRKKRTGIGAMAIGFDFRIA